MDTMVTGVMPNEGIVTAHISYEDESGNVTTFDQDIELYIYEMTYDDMNMGDDMSYDDSFMYGEETETNNNKLIYIREKQEKQDKTPLQQGLSSLRSL